MYRSYICDGVKAILENMARTNGGEHFTDRYFDLIRGLTEPSKKKEKEKEKSEIIADTIISEIMANCGLKLKNN